MLTLMLKAFFLLSKKGQIFSLDIGGWKFFCGTNTALTKPSPLQNTSGDLVWTSFVCQKTKVLPSAFSQWEVILGIIL